MIAYIHQRPEWPTFSWSNERLQSLLGDVRHRQGRLVGRMGALGFELRAEAFLETLTQEVVKSSQIEGEDLDQSQVRSSIARRLGMDIGGLLPVDRHVEGVVEMMLDATQRYAEPLTAERLFSWHAALFPTGRSGLSRITTGAWRGAESGPMQVVSGPAGRERVHFEAPTADRLPIEMQRFLEWFETDLTLDPVLKAGIAHLWFVTIHPFEDGNGRIARAITDMSLARSERSPQRFYSMSAQIQRDRANYYDILESTQKGSQDITAWLAWFLERLNRAFDGAEESLRTVMTKAKFWAALHGEALNDRQRLILNRMLDSFEGKLTSSKWAILAKTSQDTALRDIEDLVRRRILIKEAGGGRSTSYALIATPEDALRHVARYTREHAHLSAFDGPSLPTPDEAEGRRRGVAELADRIEELATRSRDEPVGYADFEHLLKQLQALGFQPPLQLVSAVASSVRRNAANPAQANAVPDLD